MPPRTALLLAALAFASAAVAQQTPPAAGDAARPGTDPAVAADNARQRADAANASSSPGTSVADDHGYRGGNQVNAGLDRPVKKQKKTKKKPAAKADAQR